MKKLLLPFLIFSSLQLFSQDIPSSFQMSVVGGFSYNFQKIEPYLSEEYMKNIGGQTLNLNYRLTKNISKKSKIGASIGLASTKTTVRFFGFTGQSPLVLNEPNFSWFDEFIEDRSYAHYLNGTFQFQYNVLKKGDYNLYLAPRFSYRQLLGISKAFQNRITNGGVPVQIRDKGEFASTLYEPIYRNYQLLPGISIGLSLLEIGYLELKFEHNLNTVYKDLNEIPFNVRYSSLGIQGGFYF